ncbi:MULTISPECIES: LysR family transcriptional regulator [unclassified Chelatococcus]|uniref:LysR family transcriptional regulator n=1 Tax=unclassified Chelatococcus TaxID=2638111 RepID=UPI001BD158D9|nr:MULTISPECIES: LysR family transcriptional regulator [unclassified Chelatococcus]MBS7697695.1 LysR family transcriptional regulator [Chelatococcus sp. YT9]MBX3558448.1 LysR family transcriptional regulator [Chelatococcus sp.]
MVEPFKHLAWDDFRLIKAIADARGLPAAAAQMGVNHSTVFRRLGQIEEALGVKLFERHRAGYALTPAGEEIVAVAERVDADITAVTRKLVGRELAPAGELRVTTNDSLLVHLLTSLFARFREVYPTIQLDVVLTNQALNLSKRDADVAIRATDKPPENLVGRRISNVAWALYGRASDFPDPETQRNADLSTLCNRTWVSLGDNLGSLNVVRFVRTHIAPENVGYKVNTVLGLAEAIEAGLGIGHLPCFIADARPSLVRLQPPDKQFEAQLWLLTHPDLRHNARVRALMDFLAAEMSQCRRYMEGEAI